MKHTMNTNQTQMIVGTVQVAKITGMSNSMHCNSGWKCSINSQVMDSIDEPDAAPRIERQARLKLTIMTAITSIGSIRQRKRLKSNIMITEDDWFETRICPMDTQLHK